LLAACGRRLAIYDCYDVLPPDQAYRLLAMLDPKTLNNVAAACSGAGSKPGKNQLAIRYGQSIERAQLRSFRADVARRCLHAVERRRVLAHKVIRPR
jgi:hypothetical protein